MAPKPTDNQGIPPSTTIPGGKARPSWAGTVTPTPTPTTTVPKAVTVKPVTTTVPTTGGKGRPSWAGGVSTASGSSGIQSPDVADAKLTARDARLDAQTVGISPEKLDEVDKGFIGSVFGAANSVLNFKIPGTKIRPAYLPFYPVDKVIELEQLIPGIVNQIQNANEGKPVDVGSFTDPFGDKGFLTELNRMITNAPRKTELFQGAQEQRGYSQVVDNPALALGLDIFAMPTTYLTGGGGGISKGFLKGVAAGGIKKAISETGEALTKAGFKKLAAEEALRLAKVASDDVAKAGILASSDAVRAAEIAVAKAESKLAKANKLIALEEANPEVLLKNAEKYATQSAPRRVYGPRSRDEIGAIIVDVAETAAKTLDDVAAGTIKLNPSELARVQSLDNVLNKTPGVLDNIINRGYAGMRGPVADALYTKGGFRLGAGQFKTPVFGEALSNMFGTGISTIRLGTKPVLGAAAIARGGFAGSEAGQAFIKWTTQLGKKGLAGEEDIRDIRFALRTGELTGERAKTAVKELALDRAYRRALAETTQQLDFLASPIFSNPADAVFAKTVEEVVTNPNINLFDTVKGGVRVTADNATSASAKLGRTISEAEWNFARRTKASFNEIWDASNQVYRQVQLQSGVKPALVKDLARSDNWFPHVLSDKARDFLRKSKSTEYDALMGYDRTFLGQLSTPRKLTAGQRVGTYTLLPADIAQGTKRLNEIMKQQLGVKFDWFATDIGEALANQVDNIASDIAFLKTLEKEIASGKTGLIKATGKEEIAAKPFVGDLETVLETSLTPQRIAAIQTIPDAVTQLDEIVATIGDIKVRVSAPGSGLLTDDIEESIQRVRQMADALGRDPNVTASMGSVITLEADALSDLLTAEARGIAGAIDIRPITDFKKVKQIVDDGFIELNKKVLPGVQAQREIATMVQNFRRMEDPAFVRGFNKYLGWYNRTFKGWVTATPGFHVRNAYSNAFFMATAGANFNNVQEAGEIYNTWLKFTDQLAGARAGTATKPGTQVLREESKALAAMTGLKVPSATTASGVIDRFIITPKAAGGLGLAPDSIEAFRIKTALENVGVAGYGRTGEVFEGAGTGFKGLGATGGTAANRASEIIGTPLTWSRQTGQTIENYSRFALTYDGIKKGLTAEQAAGRTAKYLIDYSDISRADAVMKQIIPFWMWMSRSMPLMVEILTTNPKAYIIYQKVKNAIKDEEGESDFMPLFFQQQGAFKAPFNLGGSSYLMPDLGLTGLAEDIGGLTSPSGVLASLNPVIKAPLEYWLNYDAFRKEQIANKEFDPEADAKLRKYLAKNFTVLGPVLQRYGRAGAAAAEVLNADTVAEFIRDATRTGTPAFLEETQGITEPSMSQNITTLFGFGGVPVRNLEPYQEQGEAERRTKEYQRLIQLQETKLKLK